MRLLNETTGELVRGRCRATNLCRYCQKLYVIETVEMLTLDALEHSPELWMVLTAREHLTRADTYAHLRQLRRVAKRRWPEIEWFVQVEFQRRGALHLNLLVKGVPADQGDDLRRVLGELWCSRVDAEMVGQVVRPVHDGRGLVRYLQKTLAHGLKQEQAPPIGWRGHRTSQTRGYLVRPASVMREEARAALREKRALRRAIQAGYEGPAAEAAAAGDLALAAESSWRMMDVTRSLTPSRGVASSARPARLRDEGRRSDPAEVPTAGAHPGASGAAMPRVDPGAPPACASRPPAAPPAAPGRTARQRSADGAHRAVSGAYSGP